jgi:hypothetical protein
VRGSAKAVAVGYDWKKVKMSNVWADYLVYRIRKSPEHPVDGSQVESR